MKDILATMHKDLILNENDQFSAFWAGPLTIIPPRDETSEEVAFAFLTDHCWRATCPRSVEAELSCDHPVQGTEHTAIPQHPTC